MVRTVPLVGARTAVHCPIWKPASVVGENWNNMFAQVGTLNATGYANWFICSEYDAYTQQNLAFTEADNGAWGWVSAYFYSGDSDSWPSPPNKCDGAVLTHYGNHGLHHWCPSWCTMLSARAAVAGSRLPSIAPPSTKPPTAVRRGATLAPSKGPVQP